MKIEKLINRLSDARCIVEGYQEQTDGFDDAEAKMAKKAGEAIAVCFSLLQEYEDLRKENKKLKKKVKKLKEKLAEKEAEKTEEEIDLF